MKHLLLILLFSSSISLLYGQNDINRENYFDYFSKGDNLKGHSLTTAWLNKLEVASILESLMQEAGFENISTFGTLEIEPTITVTSICYSEKSNFGFLYEPIHKAFPKKEDRKLKSLYKKYTGNDYSEKIIVNNGEAKFIKIKEIPKNFHIIMENNYWYQFTEKIADNEKLVTKKAIIEILKSDIKEILKSKLEP